MAFELHTDVILARDVAERGLRAGDVGTVVERHAVPGGDTGYSVEFFDMTGYLGRICQNWCTLETIVGTGAIG